MDRPVNVPPSCTAKLALYFFLFSGLCIMVDLTTKPGKFRRVLDGTDCLIQTVSCRREVLQLESEA
jgi:hypothetical protein